VLLWFLYNPEGFLGESRNYSLRKLDGDDLWCCVTWWVWLGYREEGRYGVDLNYKSF